MTTHVDFALTDEEVERQDAVTAGMAALGLHHVSATQISMYRDCPRQWAYRYVLGLKAPPGGALVVGSGVHAAAEVGMLAKLEGKGNPSPDDSAQAASEYVGEEVARGDIVLDDGEDAGALKDRAALLASAWATEAAPHVEPTAVEIEFNVPIAGVSVIGRMDVVTPTHVVDWKTKRRNKPNRNDVVKSVQSEIYARAANKPVTYVYVVDQAKGVSVVDVELDAGESAQARAMAESTVRGVAEGMALGVWPRNRSSWRCSARACGYYDRCMAGRDDAELRDNAAEARGAAGVMW